MEASQVQAKSRHAVWWWIALGFVCAVVVAVLYPLPWPSGMFKTPEGSGYIVGQHLSATAIAALVFTLIFGRLRPKGYLFVWIALFLVSIGSVGAASARADQEAKHFVEVTAKLFAKPGEAVDPKPELKGELGQVEGHLRRTLNATVDLQQRYHAALEEAGWTTYLDPERVYRDVSGARSEKIYADAKAVVARFRDEHREIVQGLISGADAIKVNSAIAVEALNGARESHKQLLAGIDARWDQELAQVEAAYPVVDTLVGMRGRWKLDDDGAPLFDTQADADVYNGHFNAMNAAYEAQAEAQQRELDEKRGKLSELQKAM